jgi:hypothetical protein
MATRQGDRVVLGALGAVALFAAGTAACLATTDFDPLRVGREPRDGGGEGAAAAADAADGAPAGRGCAGSRAYFCADFGAEPVDRGWDEVEATNGGTVVLDPSRWTSPGGSLRARTPAIAAGAGADAKARLQKTLSRTASAVRLSFDVHVTTAPTSRAGTELASVVFTDGATYYTLYVVLHEDRDTLLEYVSNASGSSTLQELPLIPRPTRGAWTRLELDATLARATASVMVDGKPAASVALRPPFASAEARIRVGLATDAPASEVDVSIDDVFADLP